MSAHVGVDVGEVAKELQRLADTKLGAFFASAAEDLVAAVSEAFDTSGASNGAPWKPNAPSTLRKKASEGRSLKPLIYRGVWQGNPTVESGADFAHVGTNVPYAPFNIAVRDPYAIPDAKLDEIMARLPAFLAEAAGGDQGGDSHEGASGGGGGGKAKGARKSRAKKPQGLFGRIKAKLGIGKEGAKARTKAAKAKVRTAAKTAKAKARAEHRAGVKLADKQRSDRARKIEREARAIERDARKLARQAKAARRRRQS